MKQFQIVLNYELRSFLKNKIFVGITVFLMVLIAAVMFYPRIANFFETTANESTENPADNAERTRVMLIAAENAEQAQTVQQAFAAAFPDYNVCVTENNPAAVKQQILAEKADCAFMLKGLTAYTYYVNNLSMYDENTYIADGVLQNAYQMNAMVQGGISAENAQQILTKPIEHQTEHLGKDQMQNFFYTYIMVFALYMVILLYGQMVATNVASEKSSRAMEVLVTSAKPAAMMFGKVIASCLAGLAQLVCVFGSSILFYRLNESYWGGNAIISSIFNMPLELLLYMLLFFLLGFFIYAFLYGAVGSTVSKLEDINTAVMPITMLFIIAFMVVMFSMASGNVDNIAVTVCSFIPFTSPMAMFTRLAMGTVPTYQVVLSVAILIGSVIGVGVLAAKIYRVGVLLYGTRPKMSNIIKAMRKS